MHNISEEIWIYGIVALFVALVFAAYFLKLRRRTKTVEAKIKVAKEEGLHEPVSLHPVVNLNLCLGSGACVRVCPEEDVLGIRYGKATVINASRCVGHGACFHACPTEAISLHIGTEKRGVDLPHVNQEFETNVSGIYIAGEMGGMGLIRNAVEQGKQAVENLAKNISKNNACEYDLVVVGAGPAGISASLQAKKLGLRTITLEQDSLGGTVFTFPRAKIVMTAPMDLPLHGNIKLYETSKAELLSLWNEVLGKNEIIILENKKIEHIAPVENGFNVETKDGQKYNTQKVLLAIGRRGSPRKLGIPGENSQKVAYRLIESELIKDKKIMVVGGGDSAIESALLLMEQNQVTLSYRKDKFARLKPKNNQKIQEAVSNKQLMLMLNSNLLSIEDEKVTIKSDSGEAMEVENDLVYIFAGGELPTQFLKNVGINITTKFGEALLTKKKSP